MNSLRFNIFLPIFTDDELCALGYTFVYYVWQQMLDT